MKKLLAAAMLAVCAFCGGWQIDSSYRIVIPEKPLDKTVGRVLRENAELLRDVLARAGVKVRIESAAAPVPGRKSIFLGFPDGRRYARFNGSIRIEKRDIHLTGNDFPGMFKPGPANSPRIYFLGTLSALAVFMRDFLDCRFTLPCREALVPLKRPELPEKLDREVIPPLEFASGRWMPLLLFDYATANFGRGSTYVYGGHSHDKAIPQSKYGKSHPEYFALVKGKRFNTEHYHGHCLSNPAVAELIFQEMLRHLDQGAEMVELSQTDGNRPCECSACLKMPGGKDPGERLWGFHLRLAERLAKERPGKKALVICYWPNTRPPRLTKKLPPNVTVELTRYDEKHLAEWRQYDVPGGFYVYIYNWGFYQPEGFTPKNCDPEFLHRQVLDFREFGIRGLYRCGYGELWGLEGPAYYIFNQLWNAPETDPRKLLEEYCTRVFGKAAPEMLLFYTLLYSRQKYTILPDSETKWSHLLRIKRLPGELEPPQRLLAVRYPENVISQLRNLLRKALPAMDTPAARRLRPRLEAEFDYLESTALIACCMDKLRKKNDSATGERMLKLIGRREEACRRLAPMTGGKDALANLRAGGRMYGALGFPYHFPAAYLLAQGARLCGRVLKAGEPGQLLVREGEIPHPVKVSVTAGEDNFQVKFTYLKDRAAELGEDKLNFYIEDAKKRRLKFQAWLTPKRTVYCREAVKSSAENGGGMEVLKPMDAGKTRLTLGDNPDGQAEAVFTVPYTLIGGRPAPGTKRGFNASCLRYVPGNSKKQDGFALWECNPGRLNWKQDMDRSGTLEF